MVSFTQLNYIVMLIYSEFLSRLFKIYKVLKNILFFLIDLKELNTVPPPGQPVPGYQAAPAYYPPVQPQYVAPVQPQYVAPVQPQYAPQPGLAHPLTYPQPGYQPAPYGTQPPVQPAYVQQPPMDEKPTNSDFSCPPPPAATETHQPYQPKPTQPSA